MVKLDPGAAKHLQTWCQRQFAYDDYRAVFAGMLSFLESIEADERDGYLNNSWWHAYDVAKVLRFL